MPINPDQDVHGKDRRCQAENRPILALVTTRPSAVCYAVYSRVPDISLLCGIFAQIIAPKRVRRCPLRRDGNADQPVTTHIRDSSLTCRLMRTLIPQ